MTTSTDATLEGAAIDVGRNFFLSYKQASDRFVNSGLERAGTDEQRAAKLLRRLPSDYADQVRSHFVRQSQLSPDHRARTLGDLFEVPIEAPLTARVTTGRLLERSSVRASISDATGSRPVLSSRGIRLVSPDLAVAPLSRTEVKATLVLESVRVDHSEDATRWQPWRPKDDEVIITAIVIDPVGRLHERTQFVGSIDEGQTRSFGPGGLPLIALPFATGGDAWPKSAYATIYAVERDRGGWNDVLEAIREYLDDKLTEELIKQGLEETPYVKLLPASVLSWLAGVAKGFIDDFMDWFFDLITNNDDAMGSRTRHLTMSEATADWQGTGRVDSPPWEWKFSNGDGEWTTTWHWHLTEKQVPIPLVAAR